MIDRRVLFFGDSLVAGVGDPSGLGWVGRVVAASFTADLPLSAYNLGVRGQTSVQVASRWRAEALERLHPQADCRVVLSFGINDTTLEDDRVRVPVGRSTETLATMLEELAATGVPVLVVGPAPVDDPGQNLRIRDLSAAFAEVCQERQVAFISVLDGLLASRAWMGEIADGDGAHPGTGGYEALARLVLTGGWLGWLGAPVDRKYAAVRERHTGDLRAADRGQG